ncbi:MAG: VWA domain-containing protein [Ardenticatenales bacterium]
MATTHRLDDTHRIVPSALRAPRVPYGASIALALLVAAVVPVALGSPRLAVTAAQRPRAETPTPTPTAIHGPGLCAFAGSQVPAAASVERNARLDVAIHIGGDCPVESRGRADIMLLVDRSGSMAEGGKFDAAKAAVGQFVNNVDFTRHRVGLVPFNSDPYVAQPLTDRADRVLRALGQMGTPQGSTSIGAAIRMADREFEDTGRATAVKVMVVLSDGIEPAAEGIIAAADASKATGTVFFTIGLGVDAANDTLLKVASAPSHYYRAPDIGQLGEIYQKIAAIILSFSVTDVRVHEELQGAATPEPPVAGEPAVDPGGVRTWWRPFLTADDTVLPYAVRLSADGLQPISAALWAEYTDGDGTRRRFDIPRAQVEVIAPNIRTIYLPFSARNWCFPAIQAVDVALVIDASASMAGPKLAQAVAGAKAFVDLLGPRLGESQVAVVAYDATARVVLPLSTDQARIEGALDSITPGNGTRIDRGIVAGANEAAGPKHVAENRSVIVLLTDGIQVDARDTVKDAATYARAKGAVIYALGLGDDVDVPTLLVIAGGPDAMWLARDPDALVGVYRRVGGVVVCR